MMKPAIEIKGVTKVFDSNKNRPVTALDNVSLAIDNNEFFTLLGPSGCGKTSLLRLIAGFDYPTSGEIFLHGESLRGLPPQKRPINTVFQHYSLFPHMTVAENVGFSFRMLGRSPEETNSTVDKMLKLVKMEDFAFRKPRHLSGGQQQRVALARALAASPKVLLLDEPLSALDLKLRHEMRSELKSLQRETGITFIFVTHDQTEALTMSDRIAVMSVGQIQQIGEPNEIYEQPTNHFVADFIGESNFIEATITQANEDETHCTFGDGLELLIPQKSPKNCGDKVTLVNRPEKIELDESTDPSWKGLEGQIEQNIYIGTDTIHQVALNQDIRLKARCKNLISGKTRFETGERVKVMIEPAAIRMLKD